MMTDEQKEYCEHFIDICAKKGFNQIVCLGAGGIMLSSPDWKKTATEIIALAEACKTCEKFGHQLIVRYVEK